MIEDIKLIGIEDELIEELLEKLGYDKVLSMACNYKKIRENINIFKAINVADINELLINKNDIFFKEPEEIIKKLSSINIANFVNLINEDYELIDEFFN